MACRCYDRTHPCLSHTQISVCRGMCVEYRHGGSCVHVCTHACCPVLCCMPVLSVPVLNQEASKDEDIIVLDSSDPPLPALPEPSRGETPGKGLAGQGGGWSQEFLGTCRRGVSDSA